MIEGPQHLRVTSHICLNGARDQIFTRLRTNVGRISVRDQRTFPIRRLSRKKIQGHRQFVECDLADAKRIEQVNTDIG
jgi:hypothetical protein